MKINQTSSVAFNGGLTTVFKHGTQEKYDKLLLKSKDGDEAHQKAFFLLCSLALKRGFDLVLTFLPKAKAWKIQVKKGDKIVADGRENMPVFRPSPQILLPVIKPFLTAQARKDVESIGYLAHK